MPSAEEALFAILTTGSPNPVHAVVSTRVYLTTLPQGVTYPAIRYERISTPRAQYRDLTTGRANYASPRMQVDCWALTPLAALQLAQAVYQLLEGFRGVVAGLRIDAVGNEDEGGDVDPGVGPGGADVFRQRLDFFMFHPEE